MSSILHRMSMILQALFFIQANCGIPKSQLYRHHNRYQSILEHRTIPHSSFKVVSSRNLLNNYDYIEYDKKDCQPVTNGLRCTKGGWISISLHGDYFHALVNDDDFDLYADGSKISHNYNKVGSYYNVTYRFSTVGNHSIRIVSDDNAFTIYNISITEFPVATATPIPPPTENPTPTPTPTEAPTPTRTPIPPPTPVQTPPPTPGQTPPPTPVQTPRPSRSPYRDPEQTPYPTYIPPKPTQTLMPTASSIPTSEPTSQTTSIPTPQPTSAVVSSEPTDNVDPQISSQTDKGMKKSTIGIIIGIIAATLIISACSIFAAICFCSKPLPIVPVAGDENETIHDSDPNAGIDTESESSFDDRLNDEMFNPDSEHGDQSPIS